MTKDEIEDVNVRFSVGFDGEYFTAEASYGEDFIKTTARNKKKAMAFFLRELADTILEEERNETKEV